MPRFCGEDVTDACSTYQLCGNLKAGIEGAIHSISSLWEEHGEKENWDILLVKAQKRLMRSIGEPCSGTRSTHVWQ
eukprot:5185229-Ditylum_brightwellii.AAC.1